jgi:hypothetical protein
MKFAVGAAAAVIVAASTTSASIFSPISSTGLARTSNLFGVTSTTRTEHSLISSAISRVPRGGARLMGEEDDAPEEQEVLYLPGLLNASVQRKGVRHYFLLLSRFSLRHALLCSRLIILL